MTEIDYVRSQAKHDREVRMEAIVELRAEQAKNSVLFKQLDAARRRIAELEFQRRDDVEAAAGLSGVMTAAGSQSGVLGTTHGRRHLSKRHPE